jgi:HEAT repeats
LADEIVKDAGADPPLPLMAFCLEELYRQTAPHHRLTLAAYEDFGRLRGAISRRATALLEELRKTEGEALDAALPLVFQALVHVDAAGIATRQRMFWDDLDKVDQIRLVIDELVKGRLLAAEGADGRATVTLAHEALLLEWPALREWLDCNRTQLQRIQTLLTALGDAAENVRGSAAEALGKLGPVTAEVVPALITALGDADTYVRGRVAEALGRIGPVTAEVVPALTTALQDPDQEVINAAKDALQRIQSASPAANST